MLRHKHTTPLCLVIVVLMVLTTALFCFAEGLGIEAFAVTMPYETALFSDDRVHTLDIVVDADEWQALLDTASSKEYIPATVVIDGNAVNNVGLRTKGNSSLSSIVSSDSDRYSFKVEFDHYQMGQTYYGLDKLALNNIAQDNTYLKDYVCYKMMDAFGADSPLTSFVYITVNGEEWGLYLAVEGIEESFATRTYGTTSGNLYKPDSMNMMGGNINREVTNAELPDNWEELLEGIELPEGMEIPENWQDFFGGGSADASNDDAATQMPNRGNAGGFVGGMGGFGGSSDTSLIYTDDEHDSYSSIFNNAIFDATNADKNRLIASLKQMNEGENLDEVVNIDEVLRYFVVHNFVLNFDSYTGSIIHNYYLYEQNGQLSMIAWDYNLAFGAFGGTGGMGSDNATSMVNYPIDTPVSGGTMESRPLLNQLLTNDEYLQRYHELFAEFIDSMFNSGMFTQLLDNAVTLITPYVEKDPTSFCTYDEYLTASAMLKEFCLLRAESVSGQLDGTIPATSDGQAADNSSFIDASGIDISAMGSSSMGFNGNIRKPAQNEEPDATADTTATADIGSIQLLSNQMGGTMPEGEMPNRGDMPDRGSPPEGEMPEGEWPGFGTPTEAATTPLPDTQPTLPATGDEQPTEAATENTIPNRGNQGGVMPGNNSPGNTAEATTTTNNEQLLYTAVSIGLLLVGILIAWRFKVYR